jgi:hypothetical protein
MEALMKYKRGIVVAVLVGTEKLYGGADEV